MLLFYSSKRNVIFTPFRNPIKSSTAKKIIAFAVGWHSLESIEEWTWRVEDAFGGNRAEYHHVSVILVSISADHMCSFYFLPHCNSSNKT